MIVNKHESEFCSLRSHECVAARNWLDVSYMEPLMDTDFRVAKPFGGSCVMKLRHYLQYSSQQRDEEPLYIFDG